MEAKHVVVTLEVHSLGAYPLRLTECGAVPLKNGQQIRVLGAAAPGLLATYPGHLKQVGAPSEAASLERGHYEYVQKAGNAAAEPSKPAGEGEAKPEATDTQEATETAQEGKASNRSMAGKTKGNTK